MAYNRTKGTNGISSLFYGNGSVDEFFAMLSRRSKELDAELSKMANERQRKELKTQAELRKKVLDEIAEYERQGNSITENERKNIYKKAMSEANKELQAQRVKSDNEMAKKAYGINTKYDKERQRKQAVANEESNRETLALYNDIVNAGGTLTESQKEDKARAELELSIARQSKLNEELTNALKSLSSTINAGMSSYAKYQEGINARLQGSGIDTGIYGANYFSALESKLTTAVGMNPYFSTDKMLNNLQALVEAGIASNVEQRAFIQTAKDEIATTFDATNGTLLRIIRLQQQDSTAARLGMEAYLTRFLNELADNTEYLNQTFDDVSNALMEASSIMTESASTEFEYIVQKWLGALTSVGLGSDTATGIAQAIGYLGSGNVEALSSSEYQNLLVMSAGRAGLSYSDMLTNGLTAQSTNELLKSMVGYMADISKNQSNVVRSQFARTFGLNVSDLVAASNLSSSLDEVSDNLLSFGDMYNELAYQLNQIPERLTMSGMIDTLFENLAFGLSSNVASNPALAAVWKVTNLISESGGINIPTVLAAGFGVDMNTNLENIIRSGVIGVSTLGMIGDLVSGLGTTLMPSSILQKLGISSMATSIRRGTGLSLRSSGTTTSVSAFLGNSSSDSIYENAMNVVDDTKNSAMVEASNSVTDYSQKLYEYVSDAIAGKLDAMASSLDSIKESSRDVAAATDGIRNVLDNGSVSVALQNLGFVSDLLV